MTKSWFRRSDGIHFAAEEGSASFNLMTSDGAFEQVDAPETEESAEQEKPADSAQKPTKPAAKKTQTKKPAAKKAKAETPAEENQVKPSTDKTPTE